MLKQWLEKDEAIVVDVREPSEHSTGVIPGAVLMPLATVSLRAIPNLRGRKLVLQCRSGARSQTAGETLLKEKPDLEVYNLAGGILEWAAAGNAVKQ